MELRLRNSANASSLMRLKFNNFCLQKPSDPFTVVAVLPNYFYRDVVLAMSPTSTQKLSDMVKSIVSYQLPRLC